MSAAGNLFAQGNVSGENERAVSLTTEIQNMERAVSRQGASPSERHEALVRLAQLRQLSGDIEGAARNWLEAAAAIPGTVDDDALLSCAYCLAAMGEWDRASAALEPLLVKNKRARFLDTSIKAIKSGDLTALIVLSLNPEYNEIKNEILFFLWKVSQRTETKGERWRLQLISEFPQSPEGRLASGQAVTNPNPFWLFISGFDSLPVLAGEARGSEQGTMNNEQLAISNEQGEGGREKGEDSIGRTVSSEQRVTPVVVQPSVQPPPVVQSPPVQTVRLQTGVFSREANAQAQVNALRQAGFSPSIEQRGEMWAVVVTSSQDVNRSIADLRAAGFDSFPVR